MIQVHLQLTDTAQRVLKNIGSNAIVAGNTHFAKVK
jgi:hypothetical protein